MKFHPTRFIITGASSGIGAEVALQLSARGASLALVARRRDKLEQIAAECRGAGARVAVVPADVGVPRECKRLVQEAVSFLGGLDVALLNAGVSEHSRVDSWESTEIAEDLMRINYLGAVNCAWAAIPHLKESGGSVAVVSSLQGKAGFPGFAAYSGSKHALHGFFDALRGELVDSGVGVTIVCPGPVDTEISARPEGAPGVMPVSECARLIIRAIDERRREEIMTVNGKVATLLRPFAPSFVDSLIRKKLDEFYDS